MPLARISLVKGRPAALRRSIGDAVHRALVETIDVPPHDRFQILTEHEAGDLVYDSEYPASPAATTSSSSRSRSRAAATCRKSAPSSAASPTTWLRSGCAARTCGSTSSK
jgi:hypothetical protein